MERIVEEITSVERKYKNDNRLTSSFKRVVIVSGAVLLLVECTISAVYRWDDPSRRFLAIEDVNIWIVMLSGMYHFFFLSEENRTLHQVLVEARKATRPNDHRTAAILNDFKAKTEKELKYIKTALLLIFLNYSVTPLVFTLYKLIALGETEIINLNLPFEFYHLDILSFFNFQNSFAVFLIINAFQIIFVKIIVDISKFMFLSFTGPVNKVVLDIRLLCTAVTDIDVHLRLRSKDNPTEDTLKYYMRNIVLQHVDLCRDITLVSRTIRIIAFFTLQCICTQVCLLFYWILQVDETLLKQVIDGSHALAVCGYGYLYSAVGQDIINEDELLRRTLCECSWIDKPEWFKKSVLLMLTRANRKLEIRPFGICVIDYKNFSSMMNAAYSYYNFLRTTKNY